MHRRGFLKTAAVAATPLSAAQPVRFGVDLFSIRSQGWTPFQYLDYCARWKAKVVHFSEIRFIGLEEAHLRQVRAHAEKVGIEIEIGMRSICPSSKMFDPAQGTAEEQLTLEMAKEGIRSVVVRPGIVYGGARGGIPAMLFGTALKHGAPQIVALSTFWRGEDYHQHYYKTHAAAYRIYRVGCGRDARLRQLWGGSN